MTTQTRIETVKKIDIQPGDILHIQVGGDIQDGSGNTVTWVPNNEDILAVADAWLDVIDELGLKIGVVVTHHLVKPRIVSTHINLSTWPPSVTPTNP